MENMGILRGEKERYMEENLVIFYKAITWRVLATIVTFLIAYVVTGNNTLAGGIALADTIVKILLYMGHEKAWRKISG